MLYIAAPDSGRSATLCKEIFKNIGLISAEMTSDARVESKIFPAQILFMPKQYIPEAIQASQVDVAFCDLIDAAEARLNEKLIIKRLGLNKTHLNVYLKAGENESNQISGKIVATPYPVLTSQLFRRRFQDVSIKPMHVDPFTAVERDIAHAVCDVEYSSAFMTRYQLRMHEHLFSSELVMTANTLSPQKQMILDELSTRIDAMLKGAPLRCVQFYTAQDNRGEIEKIVPTLQATHVDIATHGAACHVSMIMSERHLWDVIYRLKQLGAYDIVTTKVDQYID